MTSRIVKLQSELSPPFSATKPHIQYEIPASMGVVDLHKSYLLFKTQLNTTGTGTHKVYLGKGTTNYDASCLMRHARLTSKTKGILEEIVRVLFSPKLF